MTTVLGLNKEFSYNKNLIDLKKEFCCNGTVVQDPELGLVIQIQNIESKLRQIEEDPEGAGTAHLYSVTLKISGVANRAFEPLFERQTQAEKIRSIQGMLQRFRTLFNLPSAIRGNIRKGEYDLAAIAQVRTVYSFVGESKALNSYSEAIQNTLKLGYKAGMAKGLGIGCTYGIACMSWALVRLCREKATSNVYAMKKVKKSEMLRRGQVLLCGFLGIPPSNGVLHQSPVHTKSLTVLKRQLLSKKMVDTAKESIGGSATSLEIYGKMEEVFIKMDSEENTDSVDRELKNFKDAVLQEGNEEGRLAREFDPRKHIEAHLPVQINEYRDRIILNPINPYGKAKKMTVDIILDFTKSKEQPDMAVMI
uniref:Exocyst complex component SEC5 n=1 Tax=Zea mays TaxID=4577 RepID=A0A804MJZ6_MAIZE